MRCTRALSWQAITPGRKQRSSSVGGCVAPVLQLSARFRSLFRQPSPPGIRVFCTLTRGADGEGVGGSGSGALLCWLCNYVNASPQWKRESVIECEKCEWQELWLECAYWFWFFKMHFSHIIFFGSPFVAFVSVMLLYLVASYVSDMQWHSSYVIHPLRCSVTIMPPREQLTEIFYVCFAA